jgi:hypothetical protein
VSNAIKKTLSLNPSPKRKKLVKKEQAPAPVVKKKAPKKKDQPPYKVIKTIKIKKRKPKAKEEEKPYKVIKKVKVSKEDINKAKFPDLPPLKNAVYVKTVTINGRRTKVVIDDQFASYNYIKKWFLLDGKGNGKASKFGQLPRTSYGLWNERVNLAEGKKTTYRVTGNIETFGNEGKGTLNIGNFKIPNITIPNSFSGKDKDLYLKEWLRDKLKIQSGNISKMNTKLIESTQKHMSEVPMNKMYGIRNFYENLRKGNSESGITIKAESSGEGGGEGGECVINYIWAEMRGLHRFKYMTKTKLRTETQSVTPFYQILKVIGLCRETSHYLINYYMSL